MGKSKYKVSAFTDVGTVKKINQDSLTVQIAEYSGSEILMAVLCDGMGGYSSGEITSASMIYAFSQWFSNELPLYLSKHNPITSDYIKSAWTELIHKQNDRIIDYSNREEIITGTTVTGIIIYNNNEYSIVNIGDSRVYFIDNGTRQMTIDHSAVNFFSEEDMIKKNYSPNALIKCVGICKNVSPDFFTGKFDKSTNILICSDGFRHKLDNEEICVFFGTDNSFSDEQDMRKRITDAIETVKSRGERDNISAALISF
mgnify:FL=1